MRRLIHLSLEGCQDPHLYMSELSCGHVVLMYSKISLIWPSNLWAPSSTGHNLWPHRIISCSWSAACGVSGAWLVYSACNHSVCIVCIQWLHLLLASPGMLSVYMTYMFLIYGHFLCYRHPLVPCCPDKRGFTVTTDETTPRRFNTAISTVDPPHALTVSASSTWNGCAHSLLIMNISKYALRNLFIQPAKVSSVI